MTKSRKLIFLGLDGATWIQFDKFITSGKMPNLKNIIKEGTKGILLSTFPFTSRTSWLNMLSGANPGKHGVPHHIVEGKHKIPLLPNLLSKNNIQSIIVNNLVVFPPEKIKGIMITGGFSTPSSSKNYVFPRQLYDEINDTVNGYIPALDPSVITKIEQGKIEDAFQQLNEYGEKIVKTSLYLAKKYDWQFLLTILENTDYLHHFFWDKPEYLERFYIWLDKVLLDFKKLAEDNDANFIIVSDHGFGPIKKHFLVNSWLSSENLTKLGKPNQVRKVLSKLKINRGFVRKNLSTIGLRGIASKLTPSELKKMVPIDENEVGFIQENSGVFSEAYNEITIKMDKPENYEKTRNIIIKKLLDLEDEGTKVVKEAKKREDVFSGTFSKLAYDIQLLLNEGYCWSPLIRENFLLTSKELKISRAGDHRPEGIIIAIGPDIKKSHTLSKSYFHWDICPTILHMMETDIPSYCDGNLIREIFREQSSFFTKSISKKEISEKEFLKDIISKKNLL
ncbi:MAG: alkaline phosphatase family protein [Thermodesulfobacteriota bacterium]